MSLSPDAPSVLLYDHLRSAVLERQGDLIRSHPTLLEFAGFYGYDPRPVAVARGNEKGRGRACDSLYPRWFFLLRANLPMSTTSDRCIFSGEEMFMAEPQLSVRSAKARDIAHRLARRENRSIADVVERALEIYEARAVGREPATAFYARLRASADTDLDLEAVIREQRRAHTGPEF